MSARVRILAWYVALLALALAISALAVRTVLLRDVTNRIDSELSESAATLVALAAPPGQPGEEPYADLPSLLAAGVRNAVPEQNAAVIALLDGHAYRASSAPVPLQLEQDPALVAAWSAVTGLELGSTPTTAGEVRYSAVPVTLPGRPGRGVFVTAVFADRDLAEATRAIDIMIETMTVAMVVASVLAWFVAGRVLRPVRDVTSLAQSITESDLTRRIPVRGNDEISELARTFNRMLDRLDAAFAAQRAFVDDAGHELRTPITIIRGHLELLGDDPAERDETVAVVSDELDRMARQVDDLLVLAKAAQPAFLRLETVDVHDLTAVVFTKVAALGVRDWQLDNRGYGRAVLDGQRVTQAWVQLATNAVQHTEDGAAVELGSRTDGDTVVLWVRDWGPGIDPADQQRIFGRFARTAGERPDGSGAGLGLAIVRSIALAHHGRVEVSSALDQGATFTLTLPMEQPTTGAGPG